MFCHRTRAVAIAHIPAPCAHRLTSCPCVSTRCGTLGITDNVCASRGRVAAFLFAADRGAARRAVTGGRDDDGDGDDDDDGDGAGDGDGARATSRVRVGVHGVNAVVRRASGGAVVVARRAARFVRARADGW